MTGTPDRTAAPATAADEIERLRAEVMLQDERAIHRAAATDGASPFSDEPAEEAAAPAEDVRRVRDRSGLSWEQVACLVGVSRRSVHNWATGGVMNAENAARLSEISSAFADLPDDPASARDALLTPDPSGVSRYQHLVMTRSAIQRPEGFTVEQLIGARRDGEVTVHGEYAGTGEPVDLEHGWPRRRQ